jgi:hypothetical protein
VLEGSLLHAKDAEGSGDARGRSTGLLVTNGVSSRAVKRLVDGCAGATSVQMSAAALITTAPNVMTVAIASRRSRDVDSIM